MSGVVRVDFLRGKEYGEADRADDGADPLWIMEICQGSELELANGIEDAVEIGAVGIVGSRG